MIDATRSETDPEIIKAFIMGRTQGYQNYQKCIEAARQWFNLHFRQVDNPREVKHDFQSKEQMWKSFIQFVEEGK